MLLRMPDYCRDFRCTAGDCSDSCCIGWEIDIDEKTADYYLKLEGSFGDRLRNGIAVDDCYSFILKEERCPFLNDRNLCDIILNIGEDKLCHICAEHPRYYEWFNGVKEGGVGMSCEAAAELILEKGGDSGYLEKEIPDEPADEYDGQLYNFLCEARERISGFLRGDDKSLKEAVSALLRYSEILQECIDNGEIDKVPVIAGYAYAETVCDRDGMLRIFGGLEPIDEKWKPYTESLKSAEKSCSVTASQEKYIRNIGIYFVWRYFMKGVFDEEILSKLKLAVISMAMARLMFRHADSDDLKACTLLAKNYSKEVEYSEENLEALYDMTYTEQVFSAESLVQFF